MSLISSVAQVITEAGPYVVALAGMAVGYFGSRRTGHETRHHGRVEHLYQDMLDELEDRSSTAMHAMGYEVYGARPVRDPSEYFISTARVRLYASPRVAQAWWDALQELHVMEISSRAEDEEKARAMWKYTAAEGKLVRAMREDLSVPTGSMLWRLKTRYVAAQVAWRRQRATKARRRRQQVTRSLE